MYAIWVPCMGKPLRDVAICGEPLSAKFSAGRRSDAMPFTWGLLRVENFAESGWLLPSSTKLCTGTVRPKEGRYGLYVILQSVSQPQIHN